VTSRDRILDRRARFVAAALALAGCREGAPVAATPVKEKPQPATTDAGTPDAAPIVGDEDGDGIPDDRDKCPHEKGTVLKEGCPGPCLSIIPSSEIKVLERIYFASGKAQIKPASAPVLDALAAVLKSYPELELEVRGHTDSTEPAKLADDRARAVRDALIARGIDGKRLTTKSFAATLPLDKTDREKNRRVDFEVTHAP
jgi:OmpA-OmpF porin, OOP family